MRQHFSLSLPKSDLERCWIPITPPSFQENSGSWGCLKKPVLGQSMLCVSQLSAESMKLLPPWGMHFDIYRWICALWIILLFLLQRETCLSGIIARKMHKGRRRCNSFPQIQVMNTLFSFKTVVALVCHLYAGSGMDRKKRKALSALEVTSCYSCVARIDKNTTSSVSAGHNKQGYKIYFWNIVKLYLKYGLDLAAAAS